MYSVLIIGASGYVGSQLIPILLEQGMQVTATARDADFLLSRLTPHPLLNIEPLDLDNAVRTQQVIHSKAFDLVFFLVHGMAHGHDFIDYELALASNFAKATRNSTLKHIIYLSAIQPKHGQSQHLLARAQTGEILRQTGIPVTELRAGVIIGAGSAAFEIMRDFIYNLPILITPKKIDSRANPIALENLNYYLVKLCEAIPDASHIYEVGGPDILSYREQMQILAKHVGKHLYLYPTRLLSPSLASKWLGVTTSVPANIGAALLDGLAHDYIADSTEIEQRFPQKLISFDQAVQSALGNQGRFVKSDVWGFDPKAIKRWQPDFGYYPKMTSASIETNLSAEALWKQVIKVGSREKGYFYANRIWQLREWLDLPFGGGRPKRQSPQYMPPQVGDYIDSWKVIRIEKNKFLSLLFGMKGPGLGRLELSITEMENNKRELKIAAWWHPKGFLGLLYWLAMMPAHLFIFRGMVKALEKAARENDL